MKRIQKVSQKALREAQKKVEREHLEMVKSHVLDFLKVYPVYTLSELWEQRRISPLQHMSLEELTKFLDENGCTIRKVTDYIISRR